MARLHATSPRATRATGAMCTLFAALSLTLGLPWAADSGRAEGGTPPPLYPMTDGVAAFERALSQLTDGERLLVVFGADWCPDCRTLARALARPPVADVIGDAVTVLKINVGRWDRNLALAERFGNPIERGIPAVAVVDAHGTARAVTAAGELARARAMSHEELAEFLQALLASSAS